MSDPQPLTHSREAQSAVVDALVAPYLAGLMAFVEKNVPPEPGASQDPARLRSALEGEVSYLGVREVVRTLCNRAAADGLDVRFMLNAFFQAGQGLGSVIAYQDGEIAFACFNTILQGLQDGYSAGMALQQPKGNA